MEEPFSEEEVFSALSGFGGDKALRLDGFSMVFVKDEVMGFFREFHEYGSLEKSLNATFLVLIPKNGGVEDLRDFRPISFFF